MAYITPYQYYTNGGVAPTDANWGNYQHISLNDAYNNFMTMYVGNDKQINNVARYEILFHAKQAIKLLNFDALREIKAIEIKVGDNLKLILPPDYVDFVRISLNIGGVLTPLAENRRANTAVRYLQDNNENVLFDVNGLVQTGVSELDTARLTQSIYDGPGIYYGQYGWCVDGDWYFGYQVGGFYGLETTEANANPTFSVNNGVIDFDSRMSDQLVVLEYISDGMENGNDSNVVIHKFAEEFLYRHIKWALLNAKKGIPVYDRELAKRERKAELNNCKIRLGNLHPSQLLMSLRGQDKQIK